MKKIDCTECGLTFSGRSDKKFCSDQCRSAYNNRLNSDATNTMRNINNTLRKNRRILNDLLFRKTEQVDREELALMGFNFKYYTHSVSSKCGKQYRFWYDYGLVQEDNERYCVIRNEITKGGFHPLDSAV